MKNYLSHMDNARLRIVRAIGKEADRRRLAVYIVGGVVRDVILRKDNLDLDVAVEGDAIGLARALARTWNARLTVHKQFFTASLALPGTVRVDLAQARKERYAHPGALPAVQRGSLQEDLFRRDFTVNAMAIAIHSARFGELVDQFGGLKDLARKKIRVLHDDSFIDDPTRILRAVRFEQRLNFQIERRTLFLLKSAIKKKNVNCVKPPRYFAEFKKILCEQDPVKSLKRLAVMGGLKFFDNKPDVRIPQMTRLHVNVKKTRNKHAYKECGNWWLVYFMGLTARANDRALENILGKFHFTKNEKTGIRQSRSAAGRIKELSGRRMRASKVYQILKPLTKEAVLYLRVKTSNAIVCRRIDRFLTDHAHIKLQINGADLQKIGIASGEKMGKILQDVLCSKIDKKIHTKQDELHEALHSLEKY